MKTLIRAFFTSCFLLQPVHGQPWPNLRLLESTSWDSSFTTEFHVWQKQEIQEICESLAPRTKRDVFYSPNGKFKLEYKALYAGEKDSRVIEAVYYDSTGLKLWEDTLSFMPEISNTGEWIYDRGGVEGCGVIAFYQAKPALKLVNYVGVCFDQHQISSDGQFIAAVAEDLVVYKYDGTELWRRTLAPGIKMVAISENNRYIVTASIWFEDRWPEHYTTLCFFSKEGRLLARHVVTGGKLRFTPILRSLHISPDGKLTLAGFDATLSVFDTKTGKRKWEYHYPDAYWQLWDVCFIPGKDLIAVSVIHGASSNANARQFINLFDAKGRIENNFYLEVRDVFRTRLEGVKLKATSDGKYLIGATNHRKLLIQVAGSQ